AARLSYVRARLANTNAQAIAYDPALRALRERAIDQAEALDAATRLEAPDAAPRGRTASLQPERAARLRHDVEQAGRFLPPDAARAIGSAFGGSLEELDQLARRYLAGEPGPNGLVMRSPDELLDAQTDVVREAIENSGFVVPDEAALMAHEVAMLELRALNATTAAAQQIGPGAAPPRPHFGASGDTPRA